MSRKFYITIATGTISVLAIILFTLWHQSKIANSNSPSNWQLARINFTEAITAEQAAGVKKLIKDSGDIFHVYINEPHTAVVFAYSPGKINPEGILENVKRGKSINATLYQVSDQRVNSGCPITGSNGFVTRIGNFLKRNF